MGEKPEHTWDEAACKFLIETQHKATHERDKEKLRWLQQFLRNRQLHEIDRELIDHIAHAKAKDTSPSTANRYLALIRAILRKACHDWEWMEKIPKIRLFPEPKRRIRWLTPEQVKRLLNELPQHQQDMMIFALSTGLRQSNVINLEWNQVDLERKAAWIHPDQAKARKAIHVPLNSVAITVLLRQVGKHQNRVFTFRGNPIAWVNTRAWKLALKRAGIENFRWHDLRHTWASWLAQQGTPMNVLQELGGWESEEMVRRYAHLSKPQLMQHAELVSNILDNTILSHQKEKRG
ncbi:tyrosine-type recombinase/integrase [Nitrosomonas sp.]|uniref:tyrosine-type recombinase/integrase n=1 Tax=Nitrosomonas sp. TaxID=42353 RepID=UPI0025FAA7AB|nr:tyrosine-type recombinase/integrase [Nitrosomonas sp.]